MFDWRPFIVLAPLTASLVAIFTFSIWRTVNELEEQRKLSCEPIKGNNDMYGLGIRLGVYMQLAVSAFIDSFGDQAYSSGLIASTLWFLFALSLALSILLHDFNTHSSEAYIVISLGNAVTAVMLSKLAKFNPFKSNESYLLCLGRLLLWGLWQAATSVYWWAWINHNVPGTATCGTWGWIFVKVDLFGWFRTFNQAANVGGVIVISHLFAVYIIGTIIFCVELGRISFDRETLPASKMQIAIDYLFAPMGELRQVIYGVSNMGVPLASPSSMGDAEAPTIAQNVNNSIRSRLKEHIVAHYTKQEKDQTQQSSEIRSDDPAARETILTSGPPTPIFIAMYWRPRDKILRLLKALGFKKIKIRLLLLWDITVISYTVLNVEFSLRMNNIDDIYDMFSVGQLIPVVIGYGAVATAMCEIYLYWRESSLKVKWRSGGAMRIEPIGWYSEPKTTRPPPENADGTENGPSSVGAGTSGEKGQPASVDITPLPRG